MSRELTIEELGTAYEELLKFRDSLPRKSNTRAAMTGTLWAIALTLHQLRTSEVHSEKS